MGFSQEYQSKLVTADEAVKVVQSGDWWYLIKATCYF